MELGLVTAGLPESYFCTDGTPSVEDLARVAGVSRREAKRAITALFEVARATERGAGAVKFAVDRDALPPSGTATRDEVCEAIARLAKLGRFRIAERLAERREKRPPAGKERKVPTQDHPYRRETRGRSLRRAEAGRVVAVLTCSKCGMTGEVAFRQLCDAGEMDRKFKQQGWGVDPARCPKHNRRERHTMTIKPSAAAIAGQARMTKLLMEHFDAAGGTYSDGWSDQRIADECKLSVELIRAVRDEAFGPLREPPEVARLRADIETLSQLVAEQERGMQAVRQEMDRLKAQAAELGKRFAG